MEEQNPTTIKIMETQIQSQRIEIRLKKKVR